MFVISVLQNITLQGNTELMAKIAAAGWIDTLPKAVFSDRLYSYKKLKE